uniref:Uncharacterized protein n=1 Tax=Physcomitrium patens TaxID=3218 RepID=A0A7I4CUM7_PHYPA
MLGSRACGLSTRSWRTIPAPTEPRRTERRRRRVRRAVYFMTKTKTKTILMQQMARKLLWDRLKLRKPWIHWLLNRRTRRKEEHRKWHSIG